MKGLISNLERVSLSSTLGDRHQEGLTLWTSHNNGSDRAWLLGLKINRLYEFHVYLHWQVKKPIAKGIPFWNNKILLLAFRALIPGRPCQHGNLQPRILAGK